MSGPLRILLLLLAALCAIALGACGGAKQREEKNAYVRAVNAAQNDFSASVAAVAERIKAKSSSSEQRKTLADFQTAVDDVVRDLRGIKVPGAVKSEHAQLVSAISGFGEQIESANVVLRNPTERTIAEARNSIASASQRVNAGISSAITAINAKLDDK